MRNFLDRHKIVFSADGGGGGGGGGAPAAAAPAPAAAAASAASTPATPPAGSEGSPAPAPSGAGDPPAGAPPQTPAPAGAVYRPDGLPDHMLGKTDQETIDNLKKAVDGYRQRDAEAGVPADPKAYGEFGTEIPETIKPHLNDMMQDDLWNRVTAKAAELKVSKAQYQGLVMEMMSASAEMGILEPPVDHEAEKALLVPDSAKHLPAPEQKAARERRMTENFAFVDTMVKSDQNPTGISKEAAEFAKAMLGDTARGHEVFEYMRAMAGGKPGGPAMNLNGQAGSADPRAELARRSGLPENTPGNPKFNKQSHAELMADYQRLIPENR